MNIEDYKNEVSTHIEALQNQVDYWKKKCNYLQNEYDNLNEQLKIKEEKKKAFKNKFN